MRELWYMRDGTPLPEGQLPDLSEDNRRVGLDWVGDVKVSTVFLGLNHRFGGGAPLLFETMLFGGEYDDSPCIRYSVEDEAMQGHREAVAALRKGEKLGWFQ